MAWFPILRLLVLGFSILSGIVAIALGADVTHTTLKYASVHFPYGALGIAAGSLTLLTLPIMIVSSIGRSGWFVTTVWVEFVWLTILWILWLSTGATAVHDFRTEWITCSHIIWQFFPPALQRGCNETVAIAAFGFVVFVFLFSYTILVAILSIRSERSGRSAWTNSIQNLNAFAQPANTAPWARDYKNDVPIDTFAHPYPPVAQS